MPDNVYLFEILEKCVTSTNKVIYQSISKYPSVTRDIAIWINESVTCAQVEELLHNKAGKLLANLAVFDVYKNEKTHLNQKSVAISLTFQHQSRTLKDEEIKSLLDQLIEELNSKLDAKLRD